MKSLFVVVVGVCVFSLVLVNCVDSQMTEEPMAMVDQPCLDLFRITNNCFRQAAALDNTTNFIDFETNTLSLLASNCIVRLFPLRFCIQENQLIFECTRDVIQDAQECIQRAVPSISACVPFVVDLQDCLADEEFECPAPDSNVQFACQFIQGACLENNCIFDLFVNGSDQCSTEISAFETCLSDLPDDFQECLGRTIAALFTCAVENIDSCTQYAQLYQSVLDNFDSAEATCAAVV